jgi:hypothetical protein
MITKICCECKQEKNETEFCRKTTARDGLRSSCKDCDNARSRKNYSKNPEKHRQRNLAKYWREKPRAQNSRLVRLYGITKEQYNKMFVAQNGRCAICNMPQDSGNKRDAEKVLAVDHDHKNGRVRGLLCTACNTALGRFRDDPEFIKRALGYLEKYDTDP